MRYHHDKTMMLLKRPQGTTFLSSTTRTARKRIFSCSTSYCAFQSSPRSIPKSFYSTSSSIIRSTATTSSRHGITSTTTTSGHTLINRNKHTASTTLDNPHFLISKAFPTHIIFGANTDVGKTVVSTSLVRNSVLLAGQEEAGGGKGFLVSPDSSPPGGVHYIKPLQCGGSDEDFVRRHVQQQQQQQHQLNHCRAVGSQQESSSIVGLHTLFQWDTPASPHLASRLENKPVSDEAVLLALGNKLSWITKQGENHRVNSRSSTRPSTTSRIWIETAGGVLSPSASSPNNNSPKHATKDDNNNMTEKSSNTNAWGWSTQADLYSSLHLPAVLVGDGRLGGISATLSALESLIVRGYDVHAIVLIDSSNAHVNETYGDLNDGYGHGLMTIKEENSNVHALKEYAHRKLKLRSGSGRPMLQHPDSILALPPLPPLDVPLYEYLNSAVVQEKVQRLDSYLTQQWNEHVDTLWELGEEGSKELWWPFTQHQSYHEEKETKRPTVIDGANGDYFSILEEVKNKEGESDGSGEMVRKLHFDACASWWTQGMGHGETTLSLAAAAAAGKFGHVIFPDVVHEPARALADRLLHSKSGPGRGWASRVFFTDDGSTAMEVAIKMGMKKFVHDLESNGTKLDEKVKLTVCAQRDCYHGDTLGVMDVAEPSIFNKGQHPWYEPKGLFLDYPTISYVNGSIGISPPTSCPARDNTIMFDNIDDILDINKRLSSDKLYHHYKKVIEQEWDTYEAESDR
jgi:Adenosylmethionine-8-amino-7-oxononanoate aminotransferase